MTTILDLFAKVYFLNSSLLIILIIAEWEHFHWSVLTLFILFGVVNAVSFINALKVQEVYNDIINRT